MLVQFGHAALQPFPMGGPKRAVPTPGQPSGLAHVVGMKVGTNDPGDRQSAKDIGKDTLPQIMNSVGVHAGVDNAPPRSIAQQPQIDMVKAGQFQRHANPKHTGRDLLRLAERGGLGIGIFDRSD